MRHLATLLLVVACCGLYAADFSGTWGINVDKFIDELKQVQKIEQADAESRKMFEAMVEGMKRELGKATITIGENTLSMDDGNGQVQEPEVIEMTVADGVMTLKTKQDDKEQEVTLTLVGEDEIKMQNKGHPMVMWLVRKEAGAVPPEAPAPEDAPAGEPEAPAVP